MMFNFVFADDEGAIGYRASGAVPIRAGTDGSVPRVPPADGGDDWIGYIPKDRMPGMQNPPRAWVGTANHDTRPADFPWYYTSYVAPPYRYLRMAQVLDAAHGMTADDHWQLMRDDRNLQSDALRRAIVAALEGDPPRRPRRDPRILDGVDRADAAAPLIYQSSIARSHSALSRMSLGSRWSTTCCRSGISGSSDSMRWWQPPIRRGSTTCARPTAAKRFPT